MLKKHSSRFNRYRDFDFVIDIKPQQAVFSENFRRVEFRLLRNDDIISYSCYEDR